MQQHKEYLFRRITIALAFFVISASYGWFLRLIKVVAIENITYNNILQAHSHVTFLGWGFLSIITFVTYFFNDNLIKNKQLITSYWIMLFSLIGMLISFPLQGYKLYSILFLSVFLLSSYIYLWKLFRSIKNKKMYSHKLVRTGIIYYFVSSLAIWMIPIISHKLGKGEWYQNAIGFYTHFLYNGFFVFVLFGLLAKFFEKKESFLDTLALQKFYQLTNIAIVPAFALLLLWNDVANYIVVIGFVATGIQLISLLYMSKFIKGIWYYFKENRFDRLLLLFISGAYFIKIIFQFLGAFPKITKLAVALKPYFVIGYIHLFTLGFMSLFLLFLIKRYTKIYISNTAISLFVFGVLLSEVLLFAQGCFVYLKQKTISNFNEWLLMASSFILLGLLLFSIKYYLSKEK